MVFCGSSHGNDPLYEKSTRELATQLAYAKMDLIYGGGSIGLMGVLADQMLAHGRKVTGIIPKMIYDWEVGHKGITKLEIVEDMHERKARMAALGDAFIALPGGIGTLEEIIEAFTWLQLGYHSKPCMFYNVRGYYDYLLLMMDHMTKEGFLKKSQRDSLIISDDPKIILDILT